MVIRYIHIWYISNISPWCIFTIYLLLWFHAVLTSNMSIIRHLWWISFSAIVSSTDVDFSVLNCWHTNVLSLCVAAFPYQFITMNDLNCPLLTFTYLVQHDFYLCTVKFRKMSGQKISRLFNGCIYWYKYTHTRIPICFTKLSMFKPWLWFPENERCGHTLYDI